MGFQLDIKEGLRSSLGLLFRKRTAEGAVPQTPMVAPAAGVTDQKDTNLWARMLLVPSQRPRLASHEAIHAYKLIFAESINGSYFTFSDTEEHYMFSHLILKKQSIFM